MSRSRLDPHCRLPWRQEEQAFLVSQRLILRPYVLLWPAVHCRVPWRHEDQAFLLSQCLTLSLKTAILMWSTPALQGAASPRVTC